MAMRACLSIALLLLLNATHASAQAPTLGFSMDEGTASVLNDCSSNDHVGIFSGPVVAFTPGHDGTGGALSFVGNGRVDVSSHPSLTPATVTIEAWAKRESPPIESFRYIVGKFLNPDFASYAIYTGVGDGLYCYVRHEGNLTTSSGNVGSSFWDGEWHHFVCSFDGIELKFWVDGGLQATTPAQAPDIVYNGSSLRIGGYGGTGTAWNGEIDAVRIYDTALAPSELPAACQGANVPPIDGSLLGGSDVVGGVDYDLGVAPVGVISALFQLVTPEDFDAVTQGAINFGLPTDPAHVWELSYSGVCTEPVTLTFGYDDSGFLPFFSESSLVVYRFDGVDWLPLETLSHDTSMNKIEVTTDCFSQFVLGAPIPIPASSPMGRVLLALAMMLSALLPIARAHWGISGRAR